MEEIMTPYLVYQSLIIFKICFTGKSLDISQTEVVEIVRNLLNIKVPVEGKQQVHMNKYITVHNSSNLSVQKCM